MCETFICVCEWEREGERERERERGREGETEDKCQKIPSNSAIYIRGELLEWTLFSPTCMTCVCACA
jgi:hypothetical protein